MTAKLQKKIAIISTAHIHTRSFLRNLCEKEDDRSIHIIWDENADRGKAYASEFETRFSGNLQQVVEDDSVDGFIICSENTRHKPLLEFVIPTGKPVFCDKPLATSLQDLASIEILLSRFPDTPVFCGYFHPFETSIQGVEAWLRKGALGQITRATHRNAHHAAYARWFDSPDLDWFTKPELSGGGAFLDMGTHAVHCLRTLFGPVVSVHAIIENQSGIYPEVDDFGVAHLRFENGIIGRAEAAWTHTGGISGLEIVGSEGAIYNQGGQYAFKAPGKDAVPVGSGQPIPAKVDRLMGIISGQIDSSQWKADLQAIRDSVRIMCAAYESAKSGHWRNIE